MKNNIYVLNQRQDETFDAAGKAMRDVFSVLADKRRRSSGAYQNIAVNI